VGRRILDAIIAEAEGRGKPLRLVSSAMNLDSFSLYTRAGFVPYAAFQDMFVQVPQDGISGVLPASPRVREARVEDVPAIGALEWDISHIHRETDWQYFIKNPDGVWHVSVCEGTRGGLDGCLASCAHRAANMIGPGVARSADAAAALLLAELNRRRGRAPVFLLPVEQSDLVRQAYAWGARNCETHFAQARGEFTPGQGIVMPTFMPETG